MAQVKIEDGRLVVVVDGLARLLTSRKQVAVALAHITAVEARAEPPRSLLEHLKHMTQAGTHIPGIMQLGTFVAEDGLVFYAVGSGQRAVVIELEQEKFRRLIVEPSGGEAPERPPQRLDLGRPIEPQHSAEGRWITLFELLGTLDTQQRHHEQCHQRGA